MKIFFDTPHLYYLPQYLPVWAELKRRNIDCEFVIYKNKEMQPVLEKVVEKDNLPAKWANSNAHALSVYTKECPDWVVFGSSYPLISDLPTQTKSALLYHGIGVKSCYFDPVLTNMDIRFVEGEYRYKKLSGMFPKANLQNVGFAKLDPLFSEHMKEFEPFDLEKAGLDKNKPTLLYAPTFYPSSIERLDDHFPSHFKQYNVIIKPHFFSLSKEKYKNQRKKIFLWEKYDNAYVAKIEEYSLVPFMKVADLLISEASSAFFEFAALDRPIVWLDVLKLRWGYKGLFKYRLEKRMDGDIEQYHDICIHAKSYDHLKKAVDSQIKNPGEYKDKRLGYVRELIGKTDGRVSMRVADYLEQA